MYAYQALTERLTTAAKMTEESELKRVIRENIDYLVDRLVAIRRSTFSTAKKRDALVDGLDKLQEGYR